jgi:hypothetical protein
MIARTSSRDRNLLVNLLVKLLVYSLLLFDIHSPFFVSIFAGSMFTPPAGYITGA